MLYLLHFTHKIKDWEDKKLASGSKWQDLHLNQEPKPIVFAHTYTASHNNNTLSYILQSTLYFTKEFSYYVISSQEHCEIGYSYLNLI